MNMVEKVARAIETRRGYGWRRNAEAVSEDQRYEVYLNGACGQIAEIVGRFANETAAREFCYRTNMNTMARAAIEAMKSPPARVIRALSAWGVCAGDTAAAWDNAIQVALMGEPDAND